MGRTSLSSAVTRGGAGMSRPVLCLLSRGHLQQRDQAPPRPPFRPAAAHTRAALAPARSCPAASLVFAERRVPAGAEAGAAVSTQVHLSACKYKAEGT